jgi:hypothetical protein
VAACKQVLESLTKADLPADQKRKARQEAENRMKAAILKHMAAPTKSADPLPPAATDRWKCSGSNPEYPALSGTTIVFKLLFYIPARKHSRSGLLFKLFGANKFQGYGGGAAMRCGSGCDGFGSYPYFHQKAEKP